MILLIALVVSSMPTGSATSLPDLVAVGAGVATADPHAGDDLVLWVAVENQGAASAAGFEIVFRLDGSVISTQTIAPGMPAGANLSAIATAWTVTAGSHTVTVEVDATDAVAESNETNNARSFSFALAILGPDLKATIEDISSPIYDGGKGNATVAFRNGGTQALNATNVTAEVLVDGILHKRIDFVTPPGNVTLTNSFELPTLSAGTHTLTVRVDVHENTTDVDRSNNEATATFEVLPASDVEVRSVTLTAVDYLGGPHPLGRYNGSAEICNVGVARTLNATASFAVQTRINFYSFGSAPIDLEASACAIRWILFDTPGVVGNFSLVASVGAANQGNFSNDAGFANATRHADLGGGLGAAVPIVGIMGAPGLADPWLATIEATIANVAEQSFATAAVNATETVACLFAGVLAAPCEQLHGNYGFGQVRGCGARPSQPNVPAALAYTAFHPHDPTLGPLFEPFMPDVPDTGLRPCDEPPAIERAYETAALIDGALP